VSTTWTQSLGWIATGVFVGSYFFRRPTALRVLQMCGAALWVVYGYLIHAMPVIAANTLILVAAGWTSVSGGMSTARNRLSRAA